MYLEEERERSACEKEPGSRPPTATKIHSGWIKNLNVKGTTCGRKCEMVYEDLEVEEKFLTVYDIRRINHKGKN